MARLPLGDLQALVGPERVIVRDDLDPRREVPDQLPCALRARGEVEVGPFSTLFTVAGELVCGRLVFLATPLSVQGGPPVLLAERALAMDCRPQPRAGLPSARERIRFERRGNLACCGRCKSTSRTRRIAVVEPRNHVVAGRSLISSMSVRGNHDPSECPAPAAVPGASRAKARCAASWVVVQAPPLSPAHPLLLPPLVSYLLEQQRHRASS